MLTRRLRWTLRATVASATTWHCLANRDWHGHSAKLRASFIPPNTAVHCESQSRLARMREVAVALVAGKVDEDAASSEPAAEPGLTTSVERLKGSASVKEKLTGAAVWSMFVCAWSLTLLTPVFLLSLVLSGHWVSLSLYVLFWFLVNSGRLQMQRSERFMRWVQAMLAVYLPDGVEISGLTRSPESPTLFCVHPHGVLSVGYFLAALQLALTTVPDLVVVTNAYVFHLCPSLRLLFGVLGLEMCSSSRADFERVMQTGRSMLVMPGGFHEAALAGPADDAVYIKRRRGFLKYALTYGYAVQPIFVFGENQLYHTLKICENSRLAISDYHIPAVFFWGHPLFPWLPRSPQAGRLHVAFGKPAVSDGRRNNGRVSVEDVDMAKTQYVASLLRLYADHAQGSTLRVV